MGDNCDLTKLREGICNARFSESDFAGDVNRRENEKKAVN